MESDLIIISGKDEQSQKPKAEISLHDARYHAGAGRGIESQKLFFSSSITSFSNVHRWLLNPKIIIVSGLFAKGNKIHPL